jgi:hypothetical protein
MPMAARLSDMPDCADDPILPGIGGTLKEEKNSEPAAQAESLAKKADGLVWQVPATARKESPA